MKIKRELTPIEMDFFGKLQELFINFNAIIYTDKEKEINVVVKADENCMWNKDICFKKVLDETDIDELFEESCRLHNNQVVEQTS